MIRVASPSLIQFAEMPSPKRTASVSGSVPTTTRKRTPTPTRLRQEAGEHATPSERSEKGGAPGKVGQTLL